LRSIRTAALHALVLGAALAAASALPAFAVDTPATSGTATAGQISTVTLITGEKVTVTSQPGEQPRYQVIEEPRGSYAIYRDPTGDEYVIPAIAQPYLGHGLDRSLFDVSALVRDGLTGAAHLPVSLSYAAGTTPTAPPGVTLIGINAGTTSGYLTASSESAFAAGLRKRIGADTAAGRRTGSSPLAPGLTGIALTGASSPAPRATPLYALHTLQINVTDLTGAPTDNAYVVLDNTDSLAKQFVAPVITNGVARIEVPAGHYSVVAGFDDFDSTGNVTAARQVLISDFTVLATSGTQYVNIAETCATVPVTVRTPRSADQQIVVIDEQRGDAEGNVSELGSAAAGGVPLYVNPAPAPKVGTSRIVVFWMGTAPTPADRYLYTASFASKSGVPTDETYVLRSDQMATVSQRISSDPAATTASGVVINGAIDPSSGSLTDGWSVSEPMPGVLTHYYGTADGGEYGEAIVSPSNTFYAGPYLTFAAGHQYAEDWGHGPLTAGFDQNVGPVFCVACGSGSHLFLDFSTANDSDPTHFGRSSLQPKAESLRLYQNGRVISDQPFNAIVGSDTVPLVPTRFRAVLDESFTGVAGVSQSLVTSTDVTFTYDPASGPASELPSEDVCYAGNEDGYGSACHILPTLTVNYQLAGLDLINTSHSRTQRLDLTIAHQSYDGRSSHSPLTSAKLSISWNNGSTWQRVALAGSAGHYTATWSNRLDKTAGPELKVTAVDAAGNGIIQTVSNAYTIGSVK
jgi:hypothetical protein